MRNLSALLCCAFVLTAVSGQGTGPAPQRLNKIKILFLGDKGHHQPELRFKQIEPIMARRGIEMVYTGSAASLNPKTLASYDGLLIYANTEKITPDQEKSLLDYVESGKGFIPIHCASYCFLNSPKYIALVGAQFKSHGTGVFRTTVAEPNHPIMKGFNSFESWDETYVHTKHNEKDRIVLEYREDGKIKEPWTWVRTQGKGRVFYTAWGHDQRTWSNPGFQDLVERGIRWAVGRDPVPAKGPLSAFDLPFAVPQMTALPKGLKPFEYKDVGNQIPNYKANKGGKKGSTLNMQQVPLPAEESIKHMVTPKGLKVELVAADPDIYRPICMNWDEQGRLWIAETMDYPHNIQPSGSGKGNDRLVICEDTKGNGRMDKFTVFADKLSIPAGFTFSKGGVIVFEGQKTVFLKDTTGEGKANYREELFGTWGEGDTHGGVSNMRYGLDNWIWAMQGYNRSTVTVGGEKHTFNQGFFRFKPDGSKLEFLRSTNNNTWGLGISEEGLIFGSTANGNPSVAMVIPNRYYESVKGWKVASDKSGGSIAGNPAFLPITDKVRQVDYFGHYTAAAGHALYTARNYPQEYWNRAAFVTEPTGHLVGAFVITRDGSRFKSTNPFNLLASNDEWTSPIRAEVGPDGNVWVIDWYSYIVQHNPTPPGFKTGKGAAYSTALRSTKFGRIYKIVPDNARPAAAMSLKGASPEKLVATLKNDNMFWRLHAQRLLVERGQQDVVPALAALATDPKVDGIGLNPGAIHALWTMQGLGALNGNNAKATSAVVSALKHKSAGVRSNAVQVLPRTTVGVEEILASGLLDDADPQVRLATLLALSEMPPNSRAGVAIAEMLVRPENNKDRWIADAATAAAARHDVHFLKAIAAGKHEQVQRTLDVIGVVAEHHARGGKADALDDLVRTFAGADTKVAEAFVAGLAKGWPSGRAADLPATTEKSMQQLLTRLSAGGQSRLLRLAAAWGFKGLENKIAEIAKTLGGVLINDKESDATRIAAGKQLLDLRAGDAETVAKLLAIIGPRTSPQLSIGLLDVLAGNASSAVVPAVAKQLPALTPAARHAAMHVFLSRPAGMQLLLTALDKGEVQLGELALDQKQLLTANADKKIAARARQVLARGGALPSDDRQKVIDDTLPLIKATGDVALGKAVFTKQCATCHVHSGEGNKIGPDLTGIAVHPKHDLLVDILDPSRSVEGNFRVYNITLRDGRTLSGILTNETKTSVELIDAQAKKHVLLREDIDTLVGTPKSLMPEGFEKTLTAAEMVNLLEFLTARGQFLPVPLSKAATVVSTKGMFNALDSMGERLVLPNWGPKTVKGVPFQLVDPEGDKVPNMILFYSPQGKVTAAMPKVVKLPCNAPAKAIHMLSGVSGWGYPYGNNKGSVVLTVRLHYADGKTEDHELKNGIHFADYISRNDVPGSEFAFSMRGQQMRYLSVQPQRGEVITEIEFVKGPDPSAPVIMAVTVESR